MAIIRKYKAKVEQILNPFPDIFTVSFSSEKKFRYLPGQFLHLTLDDYDGVGQWPESRCFSMQNSPSEELLTITFVVKGKFTNRMADELIGEKNVWLKLPYGDIFQRAYKLNNCVFIAGGTGITPFLSLFTDKSFGEYDKPVLYAGFRTKNYHIFKNELEKAKRINKEFSINTVFQDKQGMLDIEKIYNENKDTIYFISGPHIMIKNFKQFLLENGISQEKIITDDWE